MRFESCLKNEWTFSYDKNRNEIRLLLGYMHVFQVIFYWGKIFCLNLDSLKVGHIFLY